MSSTIRSLVLVALSLSFCLWAKAYAQNDSLSGIRFGPRQENKGPPLDRIIVVVGDDVVTKQELQASPNSDKSMVLDELILHKLILQAVRTRGIKVSDTALNLRINEWRQQGKLTAAEQRQGTASIRQAVKTRMLIEQLQQQVAHERVRISQRQLDDEITRMLKKSSKQVKLVDVLIHVPEEADKQTLYKAQTLAKDILSLLKTETGQRIAARYDNVFYNDLGWVDIAQIPDIFAKAIIGAPVDHYLTTPIIDRDGIHILKIIAKRSVAGESLRADAASDAAMISTTRVSHILIRDAPDAKKRINAIYQQLRAGADFSMLAKQLSEDAGSAAKGGDLGQVHPGQMVPVFEAVMNNTAVGQMSAPFQSPFGYHIIKVLARQQIASNSRQALEQKAWREIFAKRASEEWQLWLLRLRQNAYVDIRQDIK